MSFQIHALPYEQFEPYFNFDEDELSAVGAQLKTVKTSPGTPCRVSLDDAKVGETVLLINYQHQSAPTPFQSSHAIFIRKDVATITPEPGDIPLAFTTRPISVRGFAQDHSLIDATLTDRAEPDLAADIEAMFRDPAIAYVHLHYAAPGCFAASVSRA